MIPWHLVFGFFPLVTFSIGLVFLILGWYLKRSEFVFFSSLLSVLGALAILVVYGSGEGAWELLQQQATVGGKIYNKWHTALALPTLGFSLFAGGVAGWMSWGHLTKKFYSLRLRQLLLVSLTASLGLIAFQAHLGVRIRREEIRVRDTWADFGLNDFIQSEKKKAPIIEPTSSNLEQKASY